MCGLSLAGAAAADPIGAPRHNPDGWIFGPPDEGYDVLRGVAHTARDTAVVPLPRPRPYVLETMGAIQFDALNPVTPAPPTAPMPQPTPLAAPGNASTPQPASAPLSATEQGAADDADRQGGTAETPKRAAVEPLKDNGGATMPPVSVSDAGGGRVKIEAHEASLGQVLTALQDSHLIHLSASDPLSGTVTGTYTGTLPQVLSRILDGRNYFLRVTASGTELHALNVSSDTDAALQSRVSSNVDAAAAPAPTFSLSPPRPASEAPKRVTLSPAAKARARAH
jgi:hypothetical protein